MLPGTLLPLPLIYIAFVCWLFRDKVAEGESYHQNAFIKRSMIARLRPRSAGNPAGAAPELMS